MINKKFNPEDVEMFAKNLFSGICDVTTTVNFPKSLKDNQNSVLVVSLASPINDLEAFGRCMVSVELFVKEKANGEKDSAKMRALQSSILDKINAYSSDSKDFIITTDTNLSFSDYDEQKRFHVTLTYITIIIKS